MRLMLIRHAETGHNRDSRVQGQADIPLSELGERQAAALGEHLRREPIAAVISSPLVRAFATAQAVAEPHGLTVTAEPDLMEMHVGEMEGLSTVEMRARFPEFLAEWITERGPALRMPGGESLLEVQGRAWEVVERLRSAYADETVALVSHNFVLGSLITRALEMPLHEFRRFRLSVCGVTTVRFRADRIHLVHLNDTCHLARAGLPSTDPWAARTA
ncbi:MAG: histidine phosphatase family protein [Dehalococcoidia bacterium]